MKCPHCDYEPTKATEDREKGELWELSNSVQLERSSGFMETQKALLRGCPACKKLFIDDCSW